MPVKLSFLIGESPTLAISFLGFLVYFLSSSFEARWRSVVSYQHFMIPTDARALRSTPAVDCGQYSESSTVHASSSREKSVLAKSRIRLPVLWGSCYVQQCNNTPSVPCSDITFMISLSPSADTAQKFRAEFSLRYSPHLHSHHAQAAFVRPRPSSSPPLRAKGFRALLSENAFPRMLLPAVGVT